MMIITIQVDTENAEDIEKAIAMLHGLGGPTAQCENEDEGKRLLSVLLAERLSGRSSSVVRTYMYRHDGVIRTIYDLDRLLKAKRFGVEGCGPKTRIEIELEVEKILAES